MIPSENESIEEIKHRLICSRLELIAARMEANAEVKKYEETINQLYELLKRVCQERDVARDQLQLLTRNSHPSTPAEPSSSIPQLDHHHPNHPLILKFKTELPSLKKSNTSVISDTSTSTALSNGSCDLSLSNDKYISSSKQGHQKKMKVDSCDSDNSNMVDGASLMIEKLACGKSLPQKGRLLQSVTEAGPLLSTLLVAPLPQWKNPPNYLSSCNSGDKGSVNPNGLIPTSLSLAFPGNSSGPCQISPASVKSEPMLYMVLDSNGMHNHTIAGKKREFL